MSPHGALPTHCRANHWSVRPHTRRRAMLARIAVAVTVAAGAIGTVSTAHAQTPAFPSKPLRFVVPFVPGSATDSAARIVAQGLGEELGVTVLVENKPGANGILGAEIAKAAVGDPHTLLVTTTTTQAANPSLYRSLPYDPVRDFAPVAKIGNTAFMLVVRPDFPAATLREFVAQVKAQPGKLNFGYGSAGSRVSGALLAQKAGLDFQAVAYKSNPPAMTDLLNGSLQFVFVDVGNAVPQIAAGKLRGLAVTTPRRAGLAPQVPTMAEAGLPGYDLTVWFGLMTPAGVPRDALQKLSAAAVAVLSRPAVRERLASTGIDADPLDGPAFGKLVEEEIVRWRGHARAAGITPE